LLWDVNTEAIARCRRLALHAAAASWHGHGIVMPAPPDSGKTTLVAGLVTAGCDYLTDEAAIIDPATGRLHPYPRSLWIEPASLAVIPGLDGRLRTGREFVGSWYHTSPDDLRPGSIGEPCAVRLVAFPIYVEGAATELTPMTRSEALAHLIANSFNFERFGGRGLGILRDVVAGADCYRLSMGDLDAAVAAILGVFR
jgi:hypothetical protein